MKVWSYCILSTTFVCALYQPMISAGAKTPVKKVKVTKIGENREEWIVSAQNTDLNGDRKITYGSVKISRSTKPGFGLAIPQDKDFYINVNGFSKNSTHITTEKAKEIKSIELHDEDVIRVVTSDGTDILDHDGSVRTHIPKKPALKKVKVTKLENNNKDLWTIESGKKLPDNTFDIYSTVKIAKSTNPGGGLAIPKQGDFYIEVHGSNINKQSNITAEITPSIKEIDILNDGRVQVVSVYVDGVRRTQLIE